MKKREFTLVETATGDVELHLNNKPCMCPFAGQQMVPVPGKLHGTVELAQFTRTCSDACQFFQMKNANDHSEQLKKVDFTCSFNHSVFGELIPYKKPGLSTVN